MILTGFAMMAFMGPGEPFPFLPSGLILVSDIESGLLCFTTQLSKGSLYHRHNHRSKQFKRFGRCKG